MSMPHLMNRMVLGIVFFLMTAASSISAKPLDSEKTPHQLIEQTTADLIAAITDAKTYFEHKPDRFYGEIERIIDPLVDFDSFARSVMGKYASKNYYKSLKTAEDRQHFVKQIERFKESFKEGLIKTYGKGLLTFNGQKIVIEPPRDSDMDKIRQGQTVTVTQLIYGSADQPYVVQFKMRLDKQKAWKLRNVTIEAINIGQVYRSQFDAAMQKYKGDMDKVIETWSVAPQEFEKKNTAL